MRSSMAFLTLLCITLTPGCSDNSLTSPELSAYEAAFAAAKGPTPQRWACYDPVDPHCLNEPPSGDPAPSASGYYLGSSFSFSNCTQEGAVNNADYDSLDDFCEYQLALAFRPELMAHPLDGALGREEYWAASLVGSTVVVVYMFGYYQDNGDPGCATGIFGLKYCGGHWGDNEFTVSYVSFDPTSQHWVLDGQFFSAHWCTVSCVPGLFCDFSRFVHRDGLQYPSGKSGTYPRIWVARSKHANYPSQRSCNSGALFDADDCNGNSTIGRFDVSHDRNVGSMSQQWINAVGSIYSPISRPGTEYFWMDIDFCGWSVASGSRSSCAPSSYADVLSFYLETVPW